jgi:serine/threonine-protein kinase
MRPDQLGRYEIVEEIGRGAMGVVYRARDPLIDRVVAIKAISVGQSRGEAEAFEKRFDREARSAGRLNHPNIVTIYDVGKNDGIAYIAMELLEGQSLRDILDSGVVLPPTTIADIAAQIADGLTSAHQAGVVHCDIKPANVMVLASGLVKITDFGIAMLPTGSRTFTGSIAGSPKYISPEQVVGRPVDARSDVFSLGAVLYEVLTGIPPFEGTAVDEILFGVINDKPAPPSGRNASLPQAFDDIVERALAKHPDDRYQSAAEMAEDLRHLALVGPRDAMGVAATGARAASLQPGDSTLSLYPAANDVESGESTGASRAVAARPRAWWRQPAVRYGVPAAAAVVTVAGLMLMSPGSRQDPAAARVASPQADASSASPAASPLAARGGADAPSPQAPAAAPMAAAARPEAPAAGPAETARVGFAVTPWGEVWIDGRKTGITPPLREITLAPGKHTIEVRNTTFKPYRQSVELAADASIRIKHKFE